MYRLCWAADQSAPRPPLDLLAPPQLFLLEHEVPIQESGAILLCMGRRPFRPIQITVPQRSFSAFRFQAQAAEQPAEGWDGT